MEKKKIVAFLFASIALIAAAVFLKMSVTGMSVADFSKTSSGASMFSGIFLFIFIAGLLVIIESKRPAESIDDIANAFYEKAVSEGRALSTEEKRTILAAQIVDYSRRNATPQENYQHRHENPAYLIGTEERERMIKEQIEGKKLMYENPKENSNSEYRRQLFMKSVAEKLRSYKK
jgi:hypothetical protein